MKDWETVTDSFTKENSMYITLDMTIELKKDFSGGNFGIRTSSRLDIKNVITGVWRKYSRSNNNIPMSISIIVPVLTFWYWLFYKPDSYSESFIWSLTFKNMENLKNEMIGLMWKSCTLSEVSEWIYQDLEKQQHKGAALQIMAKEHIPSQSLSTCSEKKFLAQHLSKGYETKTQRWVKFYVYALFTILEEQTWCLKLIIVTILKISAMISRVRYKVYLYLELKLEPINTFIYIYIE